VIKDAAELSRARQTSRVMVRRRARAAAAVAVVPIPGVDLAADVAMLLELIPAINRCFGLSPEQIEKLESPQRVALYRVMKKAGARFVGSAITADLIARTLATAGVDIAVESLAKYVPIVGSAVSGVVAYQIFRKIADAHVEDCVRIVKAFLDEESAANSR
jgi:uncharacterized protein (DUF697 family)